MKKNVNNQNMSLHNTLCTLCREKNRIVRKRRAKYGANEWETWFQTLFQKGCSYHSECQKKLTKQLKQKRDSRINQRNTGFAAAFPKNVLLVQSSLILRKHCVLFDKNIKKNHF